MSETQPNRCVAIPNIYKVWVRSANHHEILTKLSETQLNRCVAIPNTVYKVFGWVGTKISYSQSIRNPTQQVCCHTKYIGFGLAQQITKRSDLNCQKTNPTGVLPYQIYKVWVGTKRSKPKYQKPNPTGVLAYQIYKVWVDSAN